MHLLMLSGSEKHPTQNQSGHRESSNSVMVGRMLRSDEGLQPASLTASSSELRFWKIMFMRQLQGFWFLLLFFLFFFGKNVLKPLAPEADPTPWLETMFRLCLRGMSVPVNVRNSHFQGKKKSSLT